MPVHPKTKAVIPSGIGGALVAWIVGQYGVHIPPEVAAAGATLVNFAWSWMTSSQKQQARSCQCAKAPAPPESETNPIVHPG